MLLFVDFVVEFVGAEVLAAIRTPDFVMGTCELVEFKFGGRQVY